MSWSAAADRCELQFRQMNGPVWCEATRKELNDAGLNFGARNKQLVAMPRAIDHQVRAVAEPASHFFGSARRRVAIVGAADKQGWYFTLDWRAERIRKRRHSPCAAHVHEGEIDNVVEDRFLCLVRNALTPLRRNTGGTVHGVGHR